MIQNRSIIQLVHRFFYFHIKYMVFVSRNPFLIVKRSHFENRLSVWRFGLGLVLRLCAWELGTWGAGRRSASEGSPAAHQPCSAHPLSEHVHSVILQVQVTR